MQDAIKDWLEALPLGTTTLLLILGGAFLEYVFPPVPGDLAVLFGAFLVGARDFPAFPVILVVFVGTVLGMTVAYEAGRRLEGRIARGGRVPRIVRRGLEGLLPVYRARPRTLLVMNRFMPSVRAFVFVAAGAAGTSRWLVLGLGGASALVWVFGLFGLGLLAGHEFDRLVRWMDRYTLTFWILLGLVILFFLARRWQRRGTVKAGPPPGGPDSRA